MMMMLLKTHVDTHCRTLFLLLNIICAIFLAMYKCSFCKLNEFNNFVPFEIEVENYKCTLL